MANKERLIHLSHSEKKHRRLILSEERKKIEFLKQEIEKIEEREEKLMGINRLIKMDQLSVYDREFYSFEKDWLEYVLGKIDSNQRQSRFEHRYERLKKENPEVFEKLKISDKETGLTPLRSLLEKYTLGENKIKGYYTKRRF